MAQAYRASSLAKYTLSEANTDRAVPPAGNWASGDLLFGVAIGQNVTSLTRPASWVNLFNTSISTTLYIDVSVIARGGSNPSTTWTVGNGVNSRYVEIYVIALTGCNTSTPTQGTPVYSTPSSGGATHNPDPPSADVGTSGLVIICGCFLDGATGLWTAPSGYTILSDISTGAIAFAYSSSLLSGTQNPGAFSGASTSNTFWWDGATVGLAAAASETITPDKWLGRQEAQYRPKTQVVPSGTIGIKSQREQEMWREAARLEARNRQLKRAA